MSIAGDFIARADALSVRLEQTQFWCVVRALFGFHLRAPSLGRMLGVDTGAAVAVLVADRRRGSRADRAPSAIRANPISAFATVSRRESAGGKPTNS
ncbi:hypothetical protein [Chthonobacter albigriseus]|uniref:hypothetical protein n=1 Tax=Chthonobacter albigriseus TaxID=1683161 RepID=UPI0015EF729A|nr:hypothetical protein [Chthonobacter albigriseus]